VAAIILSLRVSYAVSAMQRVAASPTLNSTYARDVLVVAGCAVLALALAAATLRRTQK